jgi:hypothetical protein
MARNRKALGPGPWPVRDGPRNRGAGFGPSYCIGQAKAVVDGPQNRRGREGKGPDSRILRPVPKILGPEPEPEPEAGPVPCLALI